MRVLYLVVIAALVACGGTPPIPERGVVEADLGSWKFRRFQPVLDVEVWVEGNKAEAYTASYVTDAAEQRGRVEDADIVNVFVTRYEREAGVVRETVKLARRLAAEQGYQVEEGKIGGARTLSITGNGEAWVLWPAKQHVIKVGGRGREQVPAAMVESYADRYPSLLPGGSLEGPLPPGPDATPKPIEEPAYDPKNPKPDIDRYDPDKVKIPEREGAPATDAVPEKRSKRRTQPN
ncbi:MAG: hypothetical protein M3680_30285 [Myxococcota bacterium]|nr:hypothetical protein [Myxococcota bacterium]